MKKIGIISLISFIFLFLSSLTCCALSFTTFNEIQLILIALCILILDAISYFIFRKNFWANSICLIICSISLGFGIKAWYLYRSFNNDLLTMTLVTLCSVLHLFLFFLLTKISLFKKHKKSFLIGYIIFSIIIYIIIVSTTRTTFVSTFGYYMLAQLAFAYASVHEIDNYKDLIMKVTKYSFFSVMVILIIILIIISEGDFDFDFGFDLPSNKEKKKK